MARLTRRKALAMPLLACVLGRGPAWAQVRRVAAPGDTDWKSYANGFHNQRYAPLDQINGENFNRLQVAWRFKTDNFGTRPEYKLEGTPLIVNGTIYATVGTRRDIVALDGETGEVLWVHRESEGTRADRAPRKLSGRGLSYWTDGKDERLLYVTIGYQLIALDPQTGQRISSFGTDGRVDLKQDFDQSLDPDNSDVGLHATPAIAKDVVIVGAAHTAGNTPKTRKNVRGYVRGYDVRSGKRLWIFHTIPKKGEFGYDSWLDGTEEIGNAGVWCEISVDEELNLAYLGVELPTGDVSGQYRRGNGLFGESIVAVDIHSGERKWHYQTVHHGLWDYDIPCAPILIDVPHNGKTVKMLAQPSKQAFLYVLDRETGQPIWPIPERKVPKGDLPGEWYSPTQPIPTKPAAYDVQGIRPEDLIDYTPELHAKALELIKNYKIGPIFTPAIAYKPDGLWGTLTAPSLIGGTNWPGGSADPETGIVYVPSKTDADVMMEIKNTDLTQSDFEFHNVRAIGGSAQRNGFAPGDLTVDGLPLLKPPYARITAIDLKTGDHVWSVAHGETPDEIRNHPALKGKTIPRTGRSGVFGPLTTKSLVICGEVGYFTLPDGRKGAMLRAYDKATGADRGAVYMHAPQSGAPMTYMLGGRQYIVVPVSGPNDPGELVAYRLPSPADFQRRRG